MKVRFKILIIILLAIMMSVYSGCTAKPVVTNEPGATATTPDAWPGLDPLVKPGKPRVIRPLDSAEISQYKGQNLTASNSLPENSIKGIQKVDMTKYRLVVDGRVKQAKSYAYKEITDRPAVTKLVTLKCVEGWTATILWEGALLKDIIADSQPEADAVTVIFHAYDGYTTSLPLETVISKNLILAFKSNSVTLPPELGFPFMVVAEEKYGYKWARWVTRIELSKDPNYKGYWEQRGFDNVGNESKPLY